MLNFYKSVPMKIHFNRNLYIQEFRMRAKTFPIFSSYSSKFTALTNRNLLGLNVTSVCFFTLLRYLQWSMNLFCWWNLLVHHNTVHYILVVAECIIRLIKIFIKWTSKRRGKCRTWQVFKLCWAFSTWAYMLSLHEHNISAVTGNILSGNKRKHSHSLWWLGPNW